MTTADDPQSDSVRSTTSRRRFLAASGALALGAAGVGSAALGDRSQSMRSFTVRLENVSDGSTLQTSADGEASEQPVPLSPGAFAVHSADEPVFTSGEPERDNGLEEIAEGGKPKKLAASLAARETVAASGAFATPVGSDSPAPLGPGDAYEFAFEATPGKPTSYLSLVTMFVPSNDLFYALGGASGVPLFGGMGDMEEGSNTSPTAGDLTGEVSLWDAGTEINEEPGVGENQVQRQRAAGVGLVERGTVAPISAVNGYEYPAVEDVLKVTLSPN